VWRNPVVSHRPHNVIADGREFINPKDMENFESLEYLQTSKISRSLGGKSEVYGFLSCVPV
jgi:hypothetical protein